MKSGICLSQNTYVLLKAPKKWGLQPGQVKADPSQPSYKGPDPALAMIRPQTIRPGISPAITVYITLGLKTRAQTDPGVMGTMEGLEASPCLTMHENGEPMLADGDSHKVADPFDYGGGHVNPDQAADPGFIYDMDIFDHLLFLCAMGYNNSVISLVASERPPGLRLPYQYQT
ncbi:hypothetical protein AMTR_s00024p00138390 [Amborella trichopoda]|uniref:Uncharacterized protein n=1 Tax=Amborella trichopoda TaxID=13333 RepID=W1PUV8_AMBTC|nr:hypothetical protein AMTR_s00024p00138390 [Amborella trichopoda]